MSFDLLKSDMWSTWARLLTIFLIVDKLGTKLPYKINFKDFPGLGYHKSIK